ncbi:MAG: N-6 DNA methylase [Fermentimonas sp.]
MEKKGAKKQVKEKAVEVALWESANKLRGSVEPSEYKHVVLALIFLKFVSDKFEEQRQKLIDDGKEKYIERPEFYNMNNVFFLKEETRWAYIVSKSRQNDIALIIDSALHAIEKDNKALKGALPDNYFSRLGLDTSKLAALISEIDSIDTQKDKEQDVIGRIYEYFLSKFAIAEGKGKGEFYTPKSIVNLITELIEPYKGVIYDPCCGSGGMFVQSVKFIEAHHGNKKEVSIYGQEYTNTTYKLAKMNLAIRGISANLGERAANTFSNDLHKDLKADFIMANPPFNQKDWRAENELLDDPRWKGYDVPPRSNANYGWILTMASKLSSNGVAGFLLANGALSGGGDEYKIRKQLIENNLVEAILILPRNMFYTTDISVTLWILNKNKKKTTREIGCDTRYYRDRQQEILFMDLREMGEPFEKKYIQFSEGDIRKIADTYHTWQTATMINDTSLTTNGGKDVNHYKDIPEYCYSAGIEEIREKDYSLVPSRYIEFVNRDEAIDFDEKMKSLQQEIGELLREEKKSRSEMLAVFEDLGYKIELE